MKLTPVMTRFTLHWGEMGTRWGVNRAHALKLGSKIGALVPKTAKDA